MTQLEAFAHVSKFQFKGYSSVWWLVWDSVPELSGYILRLPKEAKTIPAVFEVHREMRTSAVFYP